MYASATNSALSVICHQMRWCILHILLKVLSPCCQKLSQFGSWDPYDSCGKVYITSYCERYYIVLLKKVSSELASLLGHQHLIKQ